MHGNMKITMCNCREQACFLLATWCLTFGLIATVPIKHLQQLAKQVFFYRQCDKSCAIDVTSLLPTWRYLHITCRFVVKHSRFSVCQATLSWQRMVVLSLETVVVCHMQAKPGPTTVPIVYPTIQDRMEERVPPYDLE